MQRNTTFCSLSNCVGFQKSIEEAFRRFLFLSDFCTCFAMLTFVVDMEALPIIKKLIRKSLFNEESLDDK